jgi:surface protein
MEAAFEKATKLDVVATDTPDLAICTSMFSMFWQCKELVGTPKFNDWDTSNITRMDRVFQEANKFNQPLGKWNTSKVTTMMNMFRANKIFNQDISGWNTSHVKSMYSMFYKASAFNQDIGNWDISALTNAYKEGAERILNGSNLSTENYSKLLKGWARDTITHQTGVKLGAAGKDCSQDALPARIELTDNYHWIISDAVITESAINDNYTIAIIDQNKNLKGNVKSNDTWISSEPDTFVVTGKEPSHGTLTLETTGEFTYKLINTGFSGTDSFIYELGKGGPQATVAIAVEGCVLHYKFDDGSGTIVTDKISGCNILNAKATNWKPNGGIVDGAYELKTTDAPLIVPIEPFNQLTTATTLSFWYKPTSSAIIKNNFIYGINAYGSENGREMHLHLPWTNGNMYMDFGANGSNSYDRIYLSSPPELAEQSWHHWVFTKDSATGTMAIYLDDKLIKKESGMTKPFGTFTSVKLGDGTNGLVDDLRLYNYALSADEIKTIGEGEEEEIGTPVIDLVLTQAGNRLTWTVMNDSEVIEYRIINSVTGEIIDTVIPTGANIYNFILEDGVKAELVVVDKHGTQTYIPIDGNKIIIPYFLKEGWNLIAIIGDQADLTPFKDESDYPIWGWNDGVYELVTGTVATQAIWVHSNKDIRVDITAQKSEAKIQLNQGWNLVGPIHNCGVPTDSISTFSFINDETDQDIYDEAYKVIIDEDGVLIRGVGYWIFSL